MAALKNTFLGCLAVLIAASAAGAENGEAKTGMKPEEYLSSSRISLRQDDSTWIISGDRLTVTLDQTNLAMTVKSGPCTWNMLPAQENELTLQADGERFNTSLLDAGGIEFSPYDTGFKTGVKIDLRDFRHEGKPLDLGLQLFVCLEEPSEELVCEVVPREGGAAVRELLWPKAFDPQSVDVTVVPAMQGMLVPRDWPKKVWLYADVTHSRGLYMPWWGHQKGESAAMLILETPDDAGCHFEHPAGGPTLMQARWIHSLGKMTYPRRARLCFFEKGDYVTLAKRYRRYAIENGLFVSLKEKIARSPLVGRLIGSPIIHTGVLYHFQPDSSHYNKDNPALNHQLVTFADRAAQLRDLAAKGVSRAYVHLDGWGYRGYDNLHPDILPPCPEAGGWEGVRLFADTCDDLGYIFAIHDQYRDYYLDAASYDERHTIVSESGNRPFHSTWAGGKQSILCSSFAPGFVSRNHRALHSNGVKVRGAYLDVFAVVPPDECYSPEHPVTRTECLNYRAECLDMVRALDGVVSSEESVDWAIPYIDLVHHGPYALDPNPGGGAAMAIPVPLFNLVYHDAIILPWPASDGKGGWGIPNTDSSYLHALANAGIPYLSINPGDEELQRIRTVCALNARVGLQEMTKHEFLDESRRKQRTTFADGTTVTVDFDSGTFEIEPELTPDEVR